MVSATNLFPIPAIYTDSFKDFFKDKLVDSDFTYENVITSGIKLPSDELLSQKDREPFILEVASDSFKKNSNKEIPRQIVSITNQMFPNLDYDQIQLYFELKTKSHPLKVSFIKNEKKLEESIYIKPGCNNRVIGNHMYNFISDDFKNMFSFNEGVFVMKGIYGNTLDKIDEEVFLASEDYKSNLVKAFVQAKFLGLGDITTKGNLQLVPKRNLLVTPENNIRFVDYDYMFKETGTNFLEHYKDVPGFLENMLEVYKEEHRRIAEKINEQHKPFFEFLDVIKDSKDAAFMSVDDRVRKYLGSENLFEHYTRTLDSYSQM